MAEIIDLQSRRVYPTSAESEASAEVEGQGPVAIPEDLELRMARALLVAQAEQENAKWVQQIENRKKRVRRGRWSLFFLGVTFTLLQWYWALAISLIIMVFMDRLVKD